MSGQSFKHYWFVLLLDMIAPGGLLLKHTHGVCSHAKLQSCHSAPMQGLQSCVEETASWYRSWKRRDCSQTALFLLCAQIRCGDLYAGKVVEEFNSCAITKHNCVAARVDVNKYPEPPPESLVKSFDINDFTVRPSCYAWTQRRLHYPIICCSCQPC